MLFIFLRPLSRNKRFRPETTFYEGLKRPIFSGNAINSFANERT